MITTIPVTQARKDLLKIVDDVDDQYSRVDITKKGKVKATLVSTDYLDALEETVYTLQHSHKDILEAEEDIKKGNVISLEDLKKEMKYAG